MSNSSKERDFKLEFIRGLSMLVIVIYHYSCALELKNIVGPYRPLWHFASGAWGAVFVIVFFMISGYVMMLQYNDVFNIKSFYKKRWLSIFPMFYMAWIVMYFVRTIQYKNPLWGGKPILLLYSLLGMDGYLKNGRENYYTVGEWFLGAIILLYILFPLLRWVYKKWKLIMTAVFVALFVILELTQTINLCKRSDIFFCVFSFWIGMLFWDYKERLKNIIVALVSLVICVLLCLIDITPYLSEIAIIHIFGIAVFTFLYNIPIEKLQNERIVKNMVIFLSKYSYAVMLVHHVLVYWGIKACQIIGLDLNIGFPVILVGIYIVAYIFKRAANLIMKKIGIIISRRKWTIG